MKMRLILAALAALLFVACDDGATTPVEHTPDAVATATDVPDATIPPDPDQGTIVDTTPVEVTDYCKDLRAAGHCRVWSEVDPYTLSSTGGWIELTCTSRPDYSKCQVEATSSVSYLNNKTFGGTGHPTFDNQYDKGNQSLTFWVEFVHVDEEDIECLNAVFSMSETSHYRHEFL